MPKHAAKATLLALCVQLGAGAAEAQPPANDPLAMLTRADLNHDGATSRAELRRFRTTMFARLDVDGDASLTPSDVSKWQFVMGREGAQAQWRQFLAALDADKSGAISRQEFIGGPSPAFDAADANKDDIVSASELAAARAALASKPARP